MDEKQKETFKVKSNQLFDKVKELLHEGNVRRVIIKSHKGKKYLEIPVTVGIVGIILLPFWAIFVAFIAALASDFVVETVNIEDKEK